MIPEIEGGGGIPRYSVREPATQPPPQPISQLYFQAEIHQRELRDAKYERIVVLSAERARAPAQRPAGRRRYCSYGGRDFGAFVVCGFGAAFDQAHGVEDGLDYGFVSYCCVDHYVVEGASGPIGVEVVFDEGDALAVDGVDKVLG